MHVENDLDDGAVSNSMGRLINKEISPITTSTSKYEVISYPLGMNVAKGHAIPMTNYMPLKYPYMLPRLHDPCCQISYRMKSTLAN